MRMHDELKQATFLEGGIKFAPEYVEHTGRERIGAQSAEPLGPKVRTVIAHPIRRQLNDSTWFSVEKNLVTVLVSHEGGVVAEAHLACECEGVRAYFEGRRAHSG